MINMVYHICPDCGEENYYEDLPVKPEIIKVDDDYKAFVNRIKDKIISLQAQLLKSYEGKLTVDPQDKLRFSAMIEVLEAMLQ